MENNKNPIQILPFLNNKEKLEDFHLCELCKDILKFPQACKHCESNFCADCIKAYVVSNNDLCPNKCKYEESKPLKLVYKALDVLQFKCPNAPCEEIVNYNNYFLHLQECKFIAMNCPFCKNKLKKGDFQQHLLECEEYELNCEVCLAKMPRKEFVKHDTLACLKRFAVTMMQEKHELQENMKKLTIEMEKLRGEFIKKEEINKILENEILKKDEQNQEIRSRLDNLERQFAEIKPKDNKLEERKSIEVEKNGARGGILKEKIIVGWDPLLSRQGRCIIDVNDSKKLRIDSESCWNHFVVNRPFTNENFIIEAEIKVTQEQNYVYFGVINENYSNSNNCMCQCPKNSFYIRCNGDISIDSTKLERKELAWGVFSTVLAMKVMLKEKQIYFSVANKEQAGPYNISGNNFRVVAGTCNKAKGEINILSCYSI